jgi:hypothetical protein
VLELYFWIWFVYVYFILICFVCTSVSATGENSIAVSNFFEQLVDPHVVKKSTLRYGTRCSQQPATYPYFGQINAIYTQPSSFLKIHFNIVQNEALKVSIKIDTNIGKVQLANISKETVIWKNHEHNA